MSASAALQAVPDRYLALAADSLAAGLPVQLAAAADEAVFLALAAAENEAGHLPEAAGANNFQLFFRYRRNTAKNVQYS